MATFPERPLAWVNAGATGLADLAFGALGVLPAWAGVLLVSLATGLGMLWVVARTSNQPGMAATKRAMHASLLEIRLFNDDLGAIFRALGALSRDNLRYFGLSLVPLAWMAVPLVLVIAQLQAFYGYEGLQVGQAALVKVESRASAGAAAATMTLEAPPSIRVETPAVHLVGSPEVLWRIVPTAEGRFDLTVRQGDRTATKTLDVLSGPGRRSPYRVSPGLLDQLLYPSEPPLPPDAPATLIAVPYPEPGLDILGWRVHWLIVFVVVSMAAAFALAKRVGVTI